MTSPSVLSNRPAMLDTRAILDAVDAVLADAVRPVELHEPRFGARERELVLDCIDTGWVSTAGKYVGQFEQIGRSSDRRPPRHRHRQRHGGTACGAAWSKASSRTTR